MLIWISGLLVAMRKACSNYKVQEIHLDLMILIFNLQSKLGNIWLKMRRMNQFYVKVDFGSLTATRSMNRRNWLVMSRLIAKIWKSLVHLLIQIKTWRKNDERIMSVKLWKQPLSIFHFARKFIYCIWNIHTHTFENVNFYFAHKFRHDLSKQRHHILHIIECNAKEIFHVQLINNMRNINLVASIIHFFFCLCKIIAWHVKQIYIHFICRCRYSVCIFVHWTTRKQRTDYKRMHMHTSFLLYFFFLF